LLILEEKKQKKKKDKDAPKRAISGFLFFQKDRRATLKNEQPSLDNKQLIIKMSEEWNAMSEADKVKFKQLADADKERYEREKKEYEKKKGTASTGKTESAKKSKATPKKKEESEEEDDEEEDNDDEE
jgi:hypothetical protein